MIIPQPLYRYPSILATQAYFSDQASSTSELSFDPPLPNPPTGLPEVTEFLYVDLLEGDVGVYSSSLSGTVLNQALTVQCVIHNYAGVQISPSIGLVSITTSSPTLTVIPSVVSDRVQLVVTGTELGLYSFTVSYDGFESDTLFISVDG